jgi:hypothetical protein
MKGEDRARINRGGKTDIGSGKADIAQINICHGLNVGLVHQLRAGGFCPVPSRFVDAGENIALDADHLEAEAPVSSR